MSYILVIWTIVGFAGMQYSTVERWDWRPIGEFHHESGPGSTKYAKEMCEEAARQLNVSKEKYRCVRSK